MNTIVALTDFSSTADNAIHYAAALAQKTGAALTLIHVYQIPVTMNDMPVLLISAEELKNNVEERLQKTKEELSAQFSSINIQTVSLIGDVADEVKDWTKEHNTDLIVTGTHESSGAERMLLGSTAAAVVRHLDLPVIAVPQQFTNYSFNRVALATDLSDIEKFPANTVIDFVRTLDAQLQVVHVSTDGTHKAFTIPALEVLQPAYRVIESEDVNKSLIELQNDVDLLIILPHEHTIIERWFFKLHTEPLLNHAQKPVLTIKN